MQQTAVDWLVSKTELNYYSDNDTLLAIAQAKLMEKEQKKDAWDNAAVDASYGNKYKSFDQYYTETYGK